MSKLDMMELIEGKSDCFTQLSQKIWERPETAYQERFAVDLLKTFLTEEGFTVKQVGDLETAFVAEYGSGEPIIGFTGEYDALGELVRKPTEDGKLTQCIGGHGCGHNLLGVGSLAAAWAVKKQIEKGEVAGTVRFYGTPGEEELSGKPLMAKTGCFDDLACALSWHPFDLNGPIRMSSLAAYSVKFRFHGIASHAGQAPEAGRSALDAVELMHVGLNYLREHVIEKARIHYMITNGGTRPNVVPEFAEEWMFIRAPKAENIKEIFARVKKIAQGAALMTETDMEYEILTGTYDYQANSALCEVIQKNFEEIGVPVPTEEERRLAKLLTDTVPYEKRRDGVKSFGGNESILKEELYSGMAGFNTYDTTATGSFDLGDVSYITPTAQLMAAAWPLGIAAHTWQSCTSAGSSIGYRAMLCAAKVLAASAYDLLAEPALLTAARSSFEVLTGGKPYASLME